MSSWRVVLTDTETLSGVAPVCPDQRKRGSAHDLIPQAVDDTRWDEESVQSGDPMSYIHDPMRIEPASVPVTQVTMDALTSSIRYAVAGSELARNNVHLRHWWDPIAQTMVLELQAGLLAERLPPERIEAGEIFIFPVPASPWQQFKALHGTAWWLRWLVRRRPPRIIEHTFRGELTVDLRRWHAYPKATMPDQAGFGTPVRVSEWDRRATWTPQ